MPHELNVEVDVLEETELPDDAGVPGLQMLVGHVLERELQEGEWSVAVVLTTDESVRALHRDFMGIDSETDVMTFPADDPHGPRGGDIVISVDRAADQAPEWGHSTWDEIRFLVAHGVLHLCGWDDASAGARSKMLDRQRELIDAFDAKTED